MTSGPSLAVFFGQRLTLATVFASFPRLPARTSLSPEQPAYLSFPPDNSDRATALGARVDRLFKITAALASAVTDAEVFEALVDSVAHAIDASSAALWVVDDATETASLVRTFGYKAATAKAFDAVALKDGTAFPALDCIRQLEPIWIDSQVELFERYPHLASAASKDRSYWIACLPLVVDGHAVGALGLTIEGRYEGDEADRTFLLLVARYASQALARLRLLDEERRLRAETEAEAARTAAMSGASRVFVEASLNLDGLLQSVIAEVTTHYAEGAGITLVADDDETLELAAIDPRMGRAMGPALAQEGLKVGQGLTGRVVASGQSLRLNDLDRNEHSAMAHPALSAVDPADVPRHVLIVPLRTRGKIIGTLGATRFDRSRAFSDRDLALLQELAERAATAIDNTRLHQENKAARARAEQLYRFAQAVVRADHAEQVFEAALDAIGRALHTDRVAILVFDDGGTMRFRAWRNLSPEYRAAVEGHSPWPRTAASPEPVLVADAVADASMVAYRPLFEREGIGALAFIPLVASSQLIGKLMVYYDEPHSHQAQEIELASAISSHLAAAVVRFAAVEKLRDTVRYHELFAGVLAHDLRNPLGAMVTAAHVLVMRYGGDKSTNPAHRIVSSGERMARMITQLLDFTRARIGGGIGMHRAEANLARISDVAIGEVETARPEWRWRREAVGDLSGTWDADRLQQVISNLAANAGQHGVAGAEITVRLDGTDPNHVTFEIRNQGCIPDSSLSGLFDPFRRAHAKSGNSSGLGLGLYITKEIVEAHGGRVAVESSEPDGTRFVVTLPRT